MVWSILQFTLSLLYLSNPPAITLQYPSHPAEIALQYLSLSPEITLQYLCNPAEITLWYLSAPPEITQQVSVLQLLYHCNQGRPHGHNSHHTRQEGVGPQL